MRLTSVATAGALLSLVLTVSACGEERSATAERVRSPQRGGETNAPKATAACRGQLRGFVGSLDTLREKLATGLDYGGYLREVRETRTAYDGIEPGRLRLGCLIVAGGSAERAFNLYIGAANSWGDCLATASCEISAVEPKLQRRWALASDLVSRAQRGLR